MLGSFIEALIEALMSAEADTVCGAVRDQFAGADELA
jgi:hypothetical protein